MRVPVLLALALFAALLAAAEFSNAAVSFRSARRGGDRVAEVLIGERVVIVLRTGAAGYGPLGRAEIVASRLRAAIADEVAVEDVQALPIASGHGVFFRGQLIVAVYREEAAAHGVPGEALTDRWRENVVLALGIPLGGPSEEDAGATADPEGEAGGPASIEGPDERGPQ